MQMTLRQYVRELQGGLNQAIGANSLQLGKGQCANFEEYKTKVGFIKGLEAANEMANNFLRQIEDAAHEAENSLPEMPVAPPSPGPAPGADK